MGNALTTAMTPLDRRRRLIGATVLGMLGSSSAGASDRSHALTVFTFGDSVLDCARYNEHGVHPGQLLVRNDDALFPEFKSRDLSSRGPAQLSHHAVDGATVADLPRQARGLSVPTGSTMALLTIGGNDLLAGLAADKGAGVRAFESALNRFLQVLPIKPVLMGTVYDPTFGNDERNFLAVDARTARANHRRVNEVIGALASRHGRLVRSLRKPSSRDRQNRALCSGCSSVRC
jgi:acyl-CoA thioesterase I